jgi:hypothetical protein
MAPHCRGTGRPSFALLAALGRTRGRRESRVRAAPAVSCATAHGKNAHEHTGSAETLRPSLRNGFTAYFVLSPVSGLSCHRHLRKNATSLAPASRRQDHTASPSALACVRLSQAARPPHPTARFVTIASRPSHRVRQAKLKLICPFGKSEIFLIWGIDMISENQK